MALLSDFSSDSHLDIRRSEKWIQESFQRTDIEEGHHLHEKLGGKIGNLKRKKDEEGNKSKTALQEDSRNMYYVGVLYREQGFAGAGLKLRQDVADKYNLALSQWEKKKGK